MDDRGADVPLLGLRALHARHGARRPARPAPPLRPGGHAQRDRPARVHDARRRPGHAVADPRAAARDDRPLRPALAEDHRRVSGSRAARPAGHRGHGPLRRRALQPVRVDRGRLGDDRHSRSDLRAAPGTAGKPPFGTIVKLYDEDGSEVADGETGRIFVGNELVFDGYTGGGNKADHQRPDVDRRRRPLRRRAAACSSTAATTR